MTRVLSALILLPLVLGVVWFLGAPGTRALAVVAAVLAVHELAAMASGLGAAFPRIPVALAAAAATVLAGYGTDAVELLMLATLTVVGVLAVATRVPGPGVLPGVAAAVFAVVYIGLPLGSLAAIHHRAGRAALLVLILTIVISDSAQYYTGRAFGRAPLAPAISPKKTREGAIGGVVFGSAAMAAGTRLVFPDAPLAVLVPAALAVVLLGIIGDLFESLLKRSAGVKDSSALIPGHGGILDRIDSWLFAAPPYYLLVRYLQA
jgi:phosphatidate cytidylyltransferase